MTAPLLVFGWGNRSRGDDALGVLFVERLLDALPRDGRVEGLEDYQLQPEHALDLVGRDRVLFVDASLAAAAPFEASVLRPARDASFSSHAMSPQALLQAYVDLHAIAPPPAWLLAIRGERFELGEPPTAAALANLDSALRWAQAWAREGSAGDAGRPAGEPGVRAGR